jgi:antirestriction protein ArdC
MPPFEAFKEPEAYYATLAHEATHWTKTTARLDCWPKRFGDSGCAMEELVAELGAAFLCADLGLSPEPRDEHAAYLGALVEGAEGGQTRHLWRRRPRSALLIFLRDCSPKRLQRRTRWKVRSKGRRPPSGHQRGHHLSANCPSSHLELTKPFNNSASRLGSVTSKYFH